MHVHCCHKLVKKFQPYKFITSRDTRRYWSNVTDIGQMSEQSQVSSCTRVTQLQVTSGANKVKKKFWNACTLLPQA